MRGVLNTLGGLWELARLGVQTRFKFTGPYWRWRIDTAFGTDPVRWPPRRQRLHAMLDYARWMYRMKRRR